MGYLFRKALYWAPRLLGIAFIVFLGWFALDAFHELDSVADTTAALLSHLVPCFVITAVLLFAWKWEWVGGVLFSGFAVYYAAENFRHPRWVVTISAPLLLVGLLFLASWLAHPPTERKRKRLEDQLESATRE